MARKYIDCRLLTNVRDCSVAISGNEEEVLDLAVIHGILAHGHDDPFELRKELRLLLRDTTEAKGASA